MKIASLLVSSFLLAIVLGMSVGCARKPDGAKISSEVQGKFSQDSGLASKQLAVQANDGVVTLAGTVDNDAQREAAGRQAASVPGVRTVINNLQVGNVAAVEPAAVTTRVAEESAVRTASATPAVKTKAGAAKKSGKARV